MAGISLCSLPQSVADSSWITELLWTFFVPFTVYQVRYYVSLFCLGQGWGGQGCGGTESFLPGCLSRAGLGTIQAWPCPAPDLERAPGSCWGRRGVSVFPGVQFRFPGVFLKLLSPAVLAPSISVCPTVPWEWGGPVPCPDWLSSFAVMRAVERTGNQM